MSFQKTEIKPENAVLLDCIRIPSAPNEFNRSPSSIWEGLDWQYLLQAALRHGIMPLLHRYLQRTGFQGVPSLVLTKLKKHVQLIAVANMYLTRELLGILSLFEGNGVFAVPFKGPALAALAYGDISLRHFSDLDLLVRREDVTKARELLVCMGFRPETDLTDRRDFLDSRHSCDFEHPGRNLRVDLHWRLMPKHIPFPLDMGDLWERLERRPLAGQRVVYSLTPEDLLLVLCVHSTKHQWERLLWISDVARLIESHPGWDWENLLKQAKRLRIERMTLLGLFLAKDLLNAKIPIEILPRIGSPPVLRMAQQVWDILFDQASLGQKNLARMLFHLRSQERLADKIRYCLLRASNPSIADWEQVRLPASLSFLYMVIRPLRLIIKPWTRVENRDS